MKYYIKQIKNPADNYTYKFVGFRLREGSKIFIDSVGGSKEPCTHIYSNGILEVTTPTFVKNPKYINIGYEY